MPRWKLVWLTGYRITNMEEKERKNDLDFCWTKHFREYFIFAKPTLPPKFESRNTIKSM